MSDRLRELLDEAVANVTPRRSDPVADVLRQGQVRRRRTVMAAALFVALTLVGVVTAVALVPVKGGPDVVGGTTDPSMTPTNSPTGTTGPSISPSNSPTEVATNPPFPPQPTPKVVAGRVVSDGLSFPAPAGSYRR